MNDDRETCEVIVLGGGPAGLATAVALARRGRSVVVLERTRYERPRAGETFGGELRPLLAELGALEDLATLAPVPFRGVQSAWGGEALVERDSILHPFGEGWHVDRARFDELLAGCARRAGVRVEAGAGIPAVARAGDGWRVRVAAGPELRARFLVDASGRGAPATATLLRDRRWLRVDRLVAVLGTLGAPAAAVEPALVLEAVLDGWWYSCPQPDGGLLAVLMTDADLVTTGGRAGVARHFLARLAATVHTAARARGATLVAPPWLARADSGLLLPDRGPGWCAVGDAVLGCDPLGGNGVARALQAAVDLAPAIDQALAGDAPSLAASDAPGRFRAYLDTRAYYYLREERWPAAPFWARRRPGDWRAAAIELDPQRVLRWPGQPPARDAIAAVEALIPHGALRLLLERLRTPAPAHVALAALRSLAPLEDRRLLVGLQGLVATGALIDA